MKHCINGQEITSDVHERLKQDCRFYMEQCGDSNNTEVYIDVNPDDLANLIQYVEIPEDDRNFMFILKKSLLEIFNLMELLHYMMSREMNLYLIQCLRCIIEDNPTIMDSINNEFHFFEREYIEKLKKTSSMSGGVSVVFAPCAYRFKQDLWVDIKVVVFKICIVRCLGFSYLHVGNMNTLHLMEPQNEIQRRMLSRSKVLVPKRIEYVDDVEFGDAINLLNCTIEYTNGCRYMGAVRIDEVFGFQRHGLGKFYSNDDYDSLESDGRYLFNCIHYGCICANERDVMCDCAYCICYNYHNEEEEEERDSDRCNFSYEKEAILLWIGEDYDFTEDERICSECRNEMYNERADHHRRQVELWNRIFELGLVDRLLDSELKNSYLHEMLYEGIQEHQKFGDFVEIKTFDDYMKYIDAPVDPDNFGKIVEHLDHVVSEFRNGRGRYYG